MKNIFKKTLKFISSRLIYLIIGIFLAISVTYVYATWNDAKTGGSGQLTETNWNELVTMIENNIGGKPVWAGYTSSTYSGNLGGIKGANTTCHAQYSGSHACTYDEIIKLGSEYPWSSLAWVIDGTMSTGASSSITKDGKEEFAASYYESTCKGWTYDAFAAQGDPSGPITDTTKGLVFVYCGGPPRYIPCCK